MKKIIQSPLTYIILFFVSTGAYAIKKSAETYPGTLRTITYIDPQGHKHAAHEFIHEDQTEPGLRVGDMVIEIVDDTSFYGTDAIWHIYKPGREYKTVRAMLKSEQVLHAKTYGGRVVSIAEKGRTDWKHVEHLFTPQQRLLEMKIGLKSKK